MYFSTNAFVALCLDCTHRHNSELQKALVSKRSKLLNWGVVKKASRPSFLLGFPCGESVGALIRDHFLATTISISELIWHLGDPYKRKPKCRRHCNYLIIERRIYLGEFGRGDGETELISSNLLAGPLLYCLSLILLQVGATKVVFAYHTDDPMSETDIKHHTFRGARTILLLNSLDKRDINETGWAEFTLTGKNVGKFAFIT